MNSTDAYCLLLVVAGVALVYWSKRRGFVRINQLGVEQFPSYARKVVSKLTDGILLISGFSLIGASGLILLAEYAGEFLMLALILLVVYLLEDDWYGRRR